jgi:hypothetical protein
MNVSELSDADLAAILLTADGKGAKVKEAALNEIVDRAIQQTIIMCNGRGYTPKGV